MFEIDKNVFGEFLAQQRKAKGYTQKELAEKLYVSDKAVSKWERALSMPDISLLMPLAKILDVSVTELLEGRKLDDSSEMDASQVEALVQKALSFSEDAPEKKKARLKKHAAIFGGCTLLTFLELVAGLRILHDLGITSLSTNLIILEALSLGFGIYFWFFMKERLPAYYDENKISAFSDGVFRMNVPGLHFNNSNWLPIIKYLRAWSVVTMVAVPLPCLLLAALTPDFWWSFGIQNIVLLAFLAGLFVPVYIIGRKYEDGADTTPTEGKHFIKTLLILLPMIAILLVIGFSGVFPSRSATRVGYAGNDGLREWSAHYYRLDGIMSKKLYPAVETMDYEITVSTESGSLSMELRDSSNSIIFSGEDLQSGSYPVTLTGTTKVLISAKDHRGSFSIAPADVP